MARTSQDRPDQPVARFAEEQDFIGRVLREAFTIMMGEFDEKIGELRSDATPAISRLLAHLDPGGTRLVELARRTDSTKQSVGELANRMAARGLVEIRPVPGPGRGKLVVATDEGRAAQRAGLRVVLAIHRRWTELIGEREMAALVGGLRGLINAVNDER